MALNAPLKLTYGLTGSGPKKGLHPKFFLKQKNVSGVEK